MVGRERLSAEDRRAAIVRSATTVFARSNYRVAAMAEIAREAGISEPAVYKYFPSKKQLFLTILERVREGTLGHWQELVDQEPDPVRTIARIALSQYDAVLAHPDTLKVQFQALSETGDADIREVLHRSFAAYRDFLASLLERCRPVGAPARSLDLGAATWTMLAVGFTLNVTSLLGFQDDLGRTTLEGLVESLARTFLDQPGTLDLLAERTSEP
jgi:TetR/AcrR family transcriptional regulator